MRAALLEQLRTGGNNLLYDDGQARFTYLEGYETVCRLAAGLQKEKPGPVLIYGDKGHRTFFAILASVVAGRPYIPIDATMPLHRLTEIVEETQPALLLSAVPVPMEAANAVLLSDWFLGRHTPLAAVSETENALAYIIFTSGSTGRSKGVPISYGALGHFIGWATKQPLLSPDHRHRVLSVSSFGFDLSVMDIYFSIFTHSAIMAPLYAPGLSLGQLMDDMAQKAVNFLVLTPTLAKMLLISKEFSAAHLPLITHFFFCGECLEVATVQRLKERFPQARVVNAYGPSECTCCVSMVEITAEMLAWPLLPAGVVDAAAVRIYLVDDEIALSGKSVFNGYFRQEPLPPGPFMTKDRGRIAEGLLYCLGRKDQLIKLQGYRIELGDVEENLLALPGIREAVVIADYDAMGTTVRQMKAFLVADDANITESAVRSALAKRMPSYMIPRKIIWMNALPVTVNGKYDRKELSRYD